MSASSKLARLFSRTIAVLAVVWCADRPAKATPASGVTFAVLNRATVPEFDARRRYRQDGEDKHRRRRRTWKGDADDLTHEVRPAVHVRCHRLAHWIRGGAAGAIP